MDRRPDNPERLLAAGAAGAANASWAAHDVTNGLSGSTAQTAALNNIPAYRSTPQSPRPAGPEVVHRRNPG